MPARLGASVSNSTCNVLHLKWFTCQIPIRVYAQADSLRNATALSIVEDHLRLHSGVAGEFRCQVLAAREG